MLARCVAEVQDEKPYLVIKNETAINCCLRQKKEAEPKLCENWSEN